MRRPYRFHVIALLLMIAPLGVLQTGCTTNPATGASSFTLLSWEEEKQMGAQAAAGMAEQFGGEVGETISSAYINEIGMKLVTGIESGVPDLDWEFTLLNDDLINAFALPGGKVFITRGLAEKLGNEAEIAGVLGHEIGHVTARHGNQRISKQIGFNIALSAGSVAVGTSSSDSNLRKYGTIGLPALAIGGNVVMLKYGRNEETEADMLGMRYMSRAGYNPSGQRRVMEILLEASSGSARQPEWLSTHPYPETRIERIDGLLATSYIGYESNPAYGLFPTAYKERMLDRLATLPPLEAD
jgi:predicted Zn-dependent protease